jgi:hypothetical protein
MWRDLIKIHEATDLFPMMSGEELQALAKDIAENGLRHGVVLWTPQSIETASGRKVPSDLYLLDGRNRLEALELSIADEEEREEAIRFALYPDTMQQGAASLLYGEVDPYTFVISANIHRRHLSAAQKREIVVKLKQNSPQLSMRAIAEATGASPATVYRAISSSPGVSNETPDPLPSDSPVEAAEPAPKDSEGKDPAPEPPPKRVAGRDGKSYPAKKEKGKVVQFDEKKAKAAHARLVDRQVNALIKYWNKAEQEARDKFLKWIDEPVFDNTKAGGRQ